MRRGPPQVAIIFTPGISPVRDLTWRRALALVQLRSETGTLMPHDVAASTSVPRANFVTLPVFEAAPVDDSIAPRSGWEEAKSKVLGETDPHRVLRRIYEREARTVPRDAAEAAVRRAAATPAPDAKTTVSTAGKKRSR